MSPAARRTAATRRTPTGRGDTAPAAAAASGTAATRPAHSWTLLTSHGRVLLLIAQQPDIRLRDVAERALITERAASGIVRDLEQAGYLTRHREGRRNTYVVHTDRAFRHPAEAAHTVGELIGVFTG